MILETGGFLRTSEIWFFKMTQKEFSIKVTGYVPFFNNRKSVIPAIQSLANQSDQLIELFGFNDGSTDGGEQNLEANDFRCFHNSVNRGRGATRYQATLLAAGEIIVCCDATNVLPNDFVSRLLPWFENPKVAAVYGRIQDPNPTGVVARWRARHLFKANHTMQLNVQAPLITYGTLMRRSAVVDVGNFHPDLRHSEDKELGDRLLRNGYHIVFDPTVAVFCNVENSIGEVLERYWRWNAGSDETISFKAYVKNIVFSIKCLAFQDLEAGDPYSAIISLLCPHVQIWTTALRRLFRLNVFSNHNFS